MPLVPPEDLADVGRDVSGGSFEAAGRKCLELLKDFGLRPADRVLDPGCGVGRTAIPLTGYITTGSYEGFDVVEPMVAWCRDNITPQFPNFRFQVADIYNKRYNPKGRLKAETFRFPFSDAEFDFVFLISVFTHMFPADVNQYVSEIARVLKPGARVVATYFLLDEQSLGAMKKGEARWRFRWRRKGCRIASLRMPEGAVAHYASSIDETYDRNGLTLERVVPGRWRGLPDGFGQDVIVARKPAV